MSERVGVHLMLTTAQWVLPNDYMAGGTVRYIVPSHRGTHVNVIVENPDCTISTYRLSNDAKIWIIPRENG